MGSSFNFFLMEKSVDGQKNYLAGSFGIFICNGMLDENKGRKSESENVLLVGQICWFYIKSLYKCWLDEWCDKLLCLHYDRWLNRSVITFSSKMIQQLDWLPISFQLEKVLFLCRTENGHLIQREYFLAVWNICNGMSVERRKVKVEKRCFSVGSRPFSGRSSVQSPSVFVFGIDLSWGERRGTFKREQKEIKSSKYKTSFKHIGKMPLKMCLVCLVW